MAEILCHGNTFAWCQAAQNALILKYINIHVWDFKPPKSLKKQCHHSTSSLQFIFFWTPGDALAAHDGQKTVDDKAPVSELQKKTHNSWLLQCNKDHNERVHNPWKHQSWMKNTHGFQTSWHSVDLITSQVVRTSGSQKVSRRPDTSRTFWHPKDQRKNQSGRKSGKKLGSVEKATSKRQETVRIQDCMVSVTHHDAFVFDDVWSTVTSSCLRKVSGSACEMKGKYQSWPLDVFDVWPCLCSEAFESAYRYGWRAPMPRWRSFTISDLDGTLKPQSVCRSLRSMLDRYVATWTILSHSLSPQAR